MTIRAFNVCLSSNVVNFRIGLMKWKSGFKGFIKETSMDYISTTTKGWGRVGVYLDIQLDKDSPAACKERETRRDETSLFVFRKP